MTEKPGRNDPCSCGSGKKYKNCCLQKEQQQKPAFSLSGKRKFVAKLLSGPGAQKETTQDQHVKPAVDYNVLMERSFGDAIHTKEKPPLPSDISEYMVKEEKEESSSS